MNILDNNFYNIIKFLVFFIFININFCSFIILYAAELLETCNNINNRLSINDFINNINLLTYSSFTKQNCHMLMKVHEKYLN